MNPFPRAVFPLVLACVLFAATRNTLFAASASTKPARLTCDSLVEPVGIDDARPLFSWQLRDPGFGARQTAYQVQVATKVASLNEDKPDVWDSGKVTSDRSVGVAYGGPALAAEKRYYWRVKVWNKDGKPYPTSDVSWWETGLMAAENWQGQWIGYEEQEERRIRESEAAWITNPGVADYKGNDPSRHDFRFCF